MELHPNKQVWGRSSSEAPTAPACWVMVVPARLRGPGPVWGMTGQREDLLKQSQPSLKTALRHSKERHGLALMYDLLLEGAKCGGDIRPALALPRHLGPTSMHQQTEQTGSWRPFGSDLWGYISLRARSWAIDLSPAIPVAKLGQYESEFQAFRCSTQDL